MPDSVVNHEMHAARVRLQAAVTAKMTCIQNAIRFTAATELVLWLSKEVSTLTLPTISLIPLAPMLLIALLIIGTLSLSSCRSATKAE